ncbi:MAG: hypothetical protein M3Q09_12945 [Gemmatimonadota bacterium]|nr:hypothetical protein [Gemmatimonadota bacterium]
MRNIQRILFVGLCVLAAACASAGQRAEGGKREATTVMVDNMALLDMNIYVVRGGQRVRLGTATGLSKTVMTIPRGIVFGATPLQFLADPIGAGRLPITETITVTEGDEVGLRIPPH